MVTFLKLLGIIVISFNLFTILKVYKADIYQKWWKYLLPVIVNFPSFVATNETGFDWKILSFYIFGSDISIGYNSSYSIVALPLGSLYIWWKMRGWEVNKEFDQIGNESNTD